jgi:hypothetical protein
LLVPITSIGRDRQDRPGAGATRRAPTFLARVIAGRDSDDVSDKRRRGDASPGPPHFGLPEHSALTIEGRVERAGGIASRAAAVRDGRERPIRSSNWAGGLWLFVGAFGLLIAVLVVLYLLG